MFREAWTFCPGTVWARHGGPPPGSLLAKSRGDLVVDYDGGLHAYYRTMGTEVRQRPMRCQDETSTIENGSRTRPAVAMAKAPFEMRRGILVAT